MNAAGWDSLNVRSREAPVAYGYATVAGIGDDVSGTDLGGHLADDANGGHPDSSSPNSGPSTAPDNGPSCSRISPTDPYYLIQAQGDTDGDGVAVYRASRCHAATASS